MPWSETLPQVSLAGTVLTALLLFFAAFGEPLLGRRAFAWLSRSRDGDERALTLLHAVTMAIHVLWGLVILVILVLSPGLTAADLGMRLPHAWGPILGGAVGGLIALAAFWVLVNGLPSRDSLPLPKKSAKGESSAEPEQHGGGRRRGAGHRGRRAAAGPTSLPEPGRQAQALLRPRTRAERSMAAGTALTSGLFAELLYRGLFIGLMASLGVPLWIAAVLSVVLFAVAHLYQGWWGLVSSGVSGTLFTILYLGTGSIWVPVLVHVALNLRSLAFPPASAAADPDEAYDEYDDHDDYDDYGDGYEYDPYEGDYDEYDDGYGRADDYSDADGYGDYEEGGAPGGTDGYGRHAERPVEETAAYGIGAGPRTDGGPGHPPMAFGGAASGDVPPHGGASGGGSPYGAAPGGGSPYGAAPGGVPPHGGAPGGGSPYGGTPAGGVPAFGEPSTPYGAAPPGSPRPPSPPGPPGEGALWGDDQYGGESGHRATDATPRTEDGRRLYPDEWIDRQYGYGDDPRE